MTLECLMIQMLSPKHFFHWFHLQLCMTICLFFALDSDWIINLIWTQLYLLLLSINWYSPARTFFQLQNAALTRHWNWGYLIRWKLSPKNRFHRIHDHIYVWRLVVYSKSILMKWPISFEHIFICLLKSILLSQSACCSSWKMQL